MKDGVIGGARGARRPRSHTRAMACALAIGFFALALALAAATTTSAVARAASAADPRSAPRVVILRAPGDAELSRQATTLLVAELQAAGFEVVEAARSPALEVRADIEAISARLQPVATFAIRPVEGGAAAELWLEDRVTGKLVIRRVELGGSADASADLALKAVELLHGSLLEVTVQPSVAGQPPPPPEVTRLIAGAGRGRSALQGIGVSAGAGMLGGIGVGVAYAPLLRLSVGGPSGWAARLSAHGLGSSPEVRADEGVAQIHQSLLLAEGLRLFRGGRRLQPLLGAGAGIYRVRGDGTGASSLFPGETGAHTSAAFALEAGLAARLGNRIALLVDASALGVTPSTRILIASREVARAGGLGLLLTASLCGVF